MLNEITKIKITGSIFDSLTTFDFFNPHEGDKEKIIKGTLLYGRNGTGKSTIAKGFRKLAGESVSTITSVSAYNDANQLVNLSEEDKKHIFVFDEDYVDRNVKLQQDHLDTIVMLGQVADLTEKINTAMSECEVAKKMFEQQDLIYKEYCDTRNVKSPKYYMNQLVNALKGDDNWAGRDREINNGRQNTGVREDTYKRFIALSPTKLKTELILEYTQKIKELESARTGAYAICQRVPTISTLYQSYNDDEVVNLLAEVIEKPELSPREKKLFALLQEGQMLDLTHRLTYFQNKETIECPYCFQSMTAEYRDSLVKSIEKVLNKITKEHQQKLQAYVLDLVSIDLGLYDKLGSYGTCIDLVAKINSSIQENNDNLNKKIDNPYEAIVVESNIIKNLACQLADALSELEKERVEFNNEANKTEPIIAELNRINGEIAYYDVIDLSNQHDKQLIEYIESKELWDKLKED